MLLDKKFLYAIWFSRIALLFGTLGCLFAGYVSIFVDSDIIKSCALITVALINGMFFFSTFPRYRIEIRFNQIKRKFSESTVSDNASPAEAPMKNCVRHLITFTIALTILTVFIITNFLLAIRAYSNNNHAIVFSHIIAIIAASFVSNTLFLIYIIDCTFQKE